MTREKEIKLEILWDALGTQPFPRKELRDRVINYVLDNYKLEPSVQRRVSHICYQIDSLVNMGCCHRVGNAMYQLDETYFNNNLFPAVQ